MGKLSLKKYVWKCVFGAEAVYALCLIYGVLLPARIYDAEAGTMIGGGLDPARLHHAFFELLPGFTWGTVSGVVFGAVDIFVFAWIFGAYMVWMYNTSREEKN